jgi:hypothetical protein
MVTTTTYLKSRRAPSVWIDTCVVVEIFSHGDLWEAHEKVGQALTIEERALRMRGSLWLAMALVQQQAMTIHYYRETERIIRKLAPPGSNSATWVSAIVHDLDPFLFDGWERQTTWYGEVQDGTEIATTNPIRDRRMIELCRNERWVLITRDGIERDGGIRTDGVFYRARAAGVNVRTPEEYARGIIRLDEARAMFDSRLRAALSWYYTSGPENERDQRAEKVSNIRSGYEAIWNLPEC